MDLQNFDKYDLFERPKILARYMLNHNATIRQTAAYFNIGKSTVYVDVTERLKRIDPILYIVTADHLKKNLANRHIHGGLATKKKYEELRKSKEK